MAKPTRIVEPKSKIIPEDELSDTFVEPERSFELLVSFARRLKQLRIERGIAARDLAADLRMHVSAIYNIERGVHALSLNRLPEFARRLHIDELDLFTFPKGSVRHALIDLSSGAPFEALRGAQELLRNWPRLR
jgi:transcriptional regulator with XRE-family HTH domain